MVITGVAGASSRIAMVITYWVGPSMLKHSAPALRYPTRRQRGFRLRSREYLRRLTKQVPKWGWLLGKPPKICGLLPFPCLGGVGVNVGE